MKLLTPQQYAHMLANGTKNAACMADDGNTHDFWPVVKLFTPAGLDLAGLEHGFCLSLTQMILILRLDYVTLVWGALNLAACACPNLKASGSWVGLWALNGICRSRQKRA